MKKNITLLAIAMIGMVAFFSCKKKDNTPTYSMTANIGGTNFSSTNSLATDTGGVFEVVGTSSTTFPAIDIFISNYTGVGTYNLSDTGTSFAELDSSLSNVVGAAHGTITVTSASSTVVSGTFSFTCTDSTKITNGAFTSKLQ